MSWFCAVPVDPPASASVGELIAELRSRVASVRWVRPEGVHLTLHFFGDLAEADRGAALEAIRSEAAKSAAFELELAGLGSFGGGRVLWLATTIGTPSLEALGLRLRRALSERGFPVEQRALVPHCTLGRAQPWASEQRAAWQRAAAELTEVHRFTARRAGLFQSQPGPGGSIHRVVDVCPLSG